MTTTEEREAERRHRGLVRSSAQRKDALLKELAEERQREAARLRDADAARTARLRALRLAKEAAESTPAVQDADVPPRRA